MIGACDMTDLYSERNKRQGIKIIPAKLTTS